MIKQNKKPKRLSTILYRHIKDLPLSIFIECICDNKLHLLGNASQSELQDVWEIILEQYNNCIGGSEINSKILNLKDIYLLQSKLQRGETIINILNLEFNRAIFEKIYLFGYYLPRHEPTIENLEHILPAFEGYLKRDFVELQDLLKNFEKDNKDNKPPQREDFINMIVAIAEHFKIIIDEEKTSVEKFCALMNRYNLIIENLLKQNEQIK